MTKILGLDLGTNSIGIAVRDTENGKNLQEQLDYFSTVRFQEGVGKGKQGEFSFAAERTKKRSTRRLYQARKYRIWATLELLIKNNCCPLSLEDLEKWSKYDKNKGLKRQYPINAEKFEQWVRLDFDGDGVSDYSSPFQLRAELMERQFDFSKEIERFKLGRALYHIAQRRGFRSSKGETISEQEKNENKIVENEDLSVVLKKSEEKKSGELIAYMQLHNLPTVGCAFARLEKEGVRIRNSKYQAVRSQYKKEIEAIFTFQKSLSREDGFYKYLISEKKGEGSIFYKRPLRSQKGLVGKCLLEPGKSRCPISHPEFEKFRAWSFINNIQYKKQDEWCELTLEQKKTLYNEKFLRTKNYFEFEEIRKWIEKNITFHELKYDRDRQKRTINYKDNTNVSGCPITARLKNLLGENWENITIETCKERTNSKSGEVHSVTYSAEDIWHVCFSFDDVEYVENFAKNDCGFEAKQIEQMATLWGAILQGYSNLSLKAIKNINRFLEKGYIYTNAVLLAKLPDIFGSQWEQYSSVLEKSLNDILKENQYQRNVYSIVNTLISNYKSIDHENKFAYKNYTYKLQQSDFDGGAGLKGINEVTKEFFGEKTWISKTNEEQTRIIESVSCYIKNSLKSTQRDYYKIPKISDALADYVSTHYQFISKKDLSKIYHPSMIEIYPKAKEQLLEDNRFMRVLGSPVVGALKNPMALRVLHALKKQINGMLLSGIIDEDTKIVVETARELNDANMRWAIAKYQEDRELENKEILDILKEFHKDKAIGDDDIDKARLLMEQPQENAKEEKPEKDHIYKNNVLKYKLWKEQGFRCMYTGKILKLSSLFDENVVDIEHTIPRSISFDNSLSNLTVCDAYFNRSIKKNLIPTQLANYQKEANGYSAIIDRLKPWIGKVEKLKDNVNYWKKQSKIAQAKERKDYCIRQRHLWQMELDYWQKKVNSFTTTEVTSGFRNSQLVDTRIITKYAYHFLRTVFNNVAVQKGAVTAEFRKILGFQGINEKKNRDKHSHHAIDAAMLTLIPSSAKREKMLDLYYKILEAKKFGGHYSSMVQDLNKEIASCGFGSIDGVDSYIEENILVNHIQKDQVLTPAHRRMRIQGKVIWKKDEKGEVILDEYGKPIPKFLITGDSIRGQLHGDTFYGAIKQGKFEKNGALIRDKNGKVQTEEEIKYVVRRDLVYKKSSNDPGFSNWDELEKCIVNKNLISMMKKQFNKEMSFKEACEQGIYMLDKQGNKVNKIRHIRCYTSIKNPLAIKKQTYLSKKEYKQNVYAEVGDLYVMCKYQNNELKNLYQVFNLFDIVQNRKINGDSIPNIIEKKEKIYNLKQVLKSGDMLLLYQKSIDELKEMDNQSLSQRLYVVERFETAGNLVVLKKHINAQIDKILGRGESVKDFKRTPERIRCGINTLNFLVKDSDFKFSTKGIEFY
ncbi:MAG: hypothetical protein MJ198_07860 [Bacteroidales bacterium]|nr:hypothetical protein [Bacteroidales bacterium]